MTTTTTTTTGASGAFAVDVLTGRELRHLLGSVLAHAGDTTVLPALGMVHLEVSGRSLFLSATDCYTLGIARRTMADDQPHDDCLAYATRWRTRLLTHLDQRGHQADLFDPTPNTAHGIDAGTGAGLRPVPAV